MSAPGAGAEFVANPRGAVAQQWTIAICSLALLCVVLRVVTRLWIVRNPGLDDVSVSVAWIFSLGVTIAISFQVKFGLGLHQPTLSQSDTTSLLKSFWVSIWIYQLALFFTKLALLLQYRRIFTQTWFRKVNYGVLAFVCISSCWTIFGSIFACVPVAAFWDPSIPSTCIPHALSWYFNAGLNVFTDIIIIVLPMPVLKNLKMPLKQRIALMGVFALGFFVCIISFIRIKNLQEIAKSDDISYTNVPASVWSAVEVDVGIICACLPSLKATVTRFFPRLFSSVGTSNALSGNALGGAGNSNYARYGQGTNFSRNDANASRLGGGGGNSNFGPAGTYNTTISANPLGRSKSQNFSKRHGNGQGTELKTFGSGTSGGRRSPSEGKIDVVTVVEQEVEHRISPVDSPYPNGSGSSLKEGSDAGSESGLFPPYEPDARLGGNGQGYGNGGGHGHGGGGGGYGGGGIAHGGYGYGR